MDIRPLSYAGVFLNSVGVMAETFAGGVYVMLYTPCGIITGRIVENYLDVLDDDKAASIAEYDAGHSDGSVAEVDSVNDETLRSQLALRLMAGSISAASGVASRSDRGIIDCCRIGSAQSQGYGSQPAATQPQKSLLKQTAATLCRW